MDLLLRVIPVKGSRFDTEGVPDDSETRRTHDPSGPTPKTGDLNGLGPENGLE